MAIGRGRIGGEPQIEAWVEAGFGRAFRGRSVIHRGFRSAAVPAIPGIERVEKIVVGG